MPTMPAAVSFGTVTGQILLANPDSADVGPEPDAVAAIGTVTFTPSVPTLTLPSGNVLLLPQPLTFSLDSNGSFSASLVATDDPDLAPVGWTYLVKFNLTNAAMASFSISVPVGSTVDLASLAPQLASNGTYYAANDTAFAQALNTVGSATRAAATALYAPPAGIGAWVQLVGDTLTLSLALALLNKARAAAVPAQAALVLYPDDSTHASDVAINGVVQYCLKNHLNLKLDSHTYRMDDSLIVGLLATDGITFQNSEIIIEGAGKTYAGQSFSFIGTTLTFTKSDRPAVVAQGLRYARISKMAVMGLLNTWITSNFLACLPIESGGTHVPAVDDLVDTNWNDPSLWAYADARFTPYAGLALDPYCGAAPTNRYGSTLNYNAPQSSDVKWSDIYVEGFNTGYVNQPCNYDGNGDYTSLDRMSFSKCKYGISVCNGQSRCFDMREITMYLCYTGITNVTHGMQRGQFGGEMYDISMGNVIHIFNVSTNVGQSISVTHMQAELIYDIGTIAQATAADVTARLVSPQLNFGLQIDWRGIPGWTLTGPANGNCTANLDIDGGSLSFPSVLGIKGDNVVFKSSVAVRPNSRTTSVTNPNERYANNVLAGGVIFGNGYARRPQSFSFNQFNVDTGAEQSNVTDVGAATPLAHRSFCVPLVAMHEVPTYSPRDRVATYANNNLGDNSISKSTAGMTVTTVAKTLTITFPAAGRSPQSQLVQGGMPGDVLIDAVTGLTAFIRSWDSTGLVITADIQSGYRTTDGGATYTYPGFVSNTGSFKVVNSRYYVLTGGYVNGDLTSGSNTIANFTNDSTYVPVIGTDIAVGDLVGFNQLIERLYVPSSASPPPEQITALDGTAHTITTSGNANKTRTQRRMAIFVRQGAANR